MTMPTLHADLCPTCHGSGVVADYEGSAMDCAKCGGLGCQIPEWVVVPKREWVLDPAHHGYTSEADPDWQPGTEVTVTANCPTGCSYDPRYGRREYPTGGGYTRAWVPCICDGEQMPGKVTVGTVRIAELASFPMSVYHDSPITSVWGDGWYWHRSGVGDTEIPLDIDCSPGDTIARLETP